MNAAVAQSPEHGFKGREGPEAQQGRPEHSRENACTTFIEKSCTVALVTTEFSINTAGLLAMGQVKMGCC